MVYVPFVGKTDLYAATQLVMITWICGAVACIVLVVVVITVFTLRSR